MSGAVVAPELLDIAGVSAAGLAVASTVLDVPHSNVLLTLAGGPRNGFSPNLTVVRGLEQPGRLCDEVVKGYENASTGLPGWRTASSFAWADQDLGATVWVLTGRIRAGELVPEPVESVTVLLVYDLPDMARPVQLVVTTFTDQKDLRDAVCENVFVCGARLSTALAAGSSRRGDSSAD